MVIEIEGKNIPRHWGTYECVISWYSFVSVAARYLYGILCVEISACSSQIGLQDLIIVVLLCMQHYSSFDDSWTHRRTTEVGTGEKNKWNVFISRKHDFIQILSAHQGKIIWHIFICSYTKQWIKFIYIT